eukprot:CAMPEP_0197056008 /NCGR_PEP_ID=MMETSP1384-20130603/77297_1 /TAXON_ID=29189 /ORGANISM="Ammonia sp." /LENGTH=103 /DNA_ID=CAMNT_0042489823 /DNA_START=34 /DNA_END=345 /DNA_ORIENTATION=+
MTRSTITSAFAIISTILFTVFVGIRFETHADTPEEEEQHEMEVWVQSLVLFMHDLINCVCIYLNLDFTKQLYLMVCGSCDYGCEYLSIVSTERYIERSTREII